MDDDFENIASGLPAVKKGHVLIVDDEPSVLESLSGLFQQNGYLTSTAADGHKAIEQFKIRAYDLVVMDVLMEGMNGLDAVRQIRQMSPHQKVVFHTGYPGDFPEHKIVPEYNPFPNSPSGMQMGYVVKGTTDTVRQLLAHAVTATEQYTELRKKAKAIIQETFEKGRPCHYTQIFDLPNNEIVDYPKMKDMTAEQVKEQLDTRQVPDTEKETLVFCEISGQMMQDFIDHEHLLCPCLKIEDPNTYNHIQKKPRKEISSKLCKYYEIENHILADWLRRHHDE